jgi:CRISPR-associated protein (TIGR02710 family)
MTSFETDVEKWKQLLRENPSRAKEFYNASVFPEAISRFCHKAKNLQRHRFLISLVGFSPQPIILFIKAIRPEKVLFLYSEESEGMLDIVGQHTELTLSQIEKSMVDSSDVTDVYRGIKRFLADKNQGDVFVDITGGKKSMVAGAALAGYILGLSVGYVDYEKYLPDLRQPEPGTEYASILKNPLSVFGDLEMSKAREFFNQGHFARAREIAENLEARIPDVWPARELKDLIEVYKAWDELNFASALDAVKNFLTRHEYHADKRLLECVRKHLEVLTILANLQHPSSSLYLALTFFCVGKRLASRQRYDMAVLLTYRTIEQTLSMFLQESGIDSSAPVYPPKCTREAYNQKLREVYEKQYYEKDLPTKLALMDQAIVLSLLDHKIVSRLDLKKLKGIVELRNSCIFAHGMKTMIEEDWGRFRRIAAKLLAEALKIRGGGDQDLSTYEENFAFPHLP